MGPTLARRTTGICAALLGLVAANCRRTPTVPIAGLGPSRVDSADVRAQAEEPSVRVVGEGAAVVGEGAAGVPDAASSEVGVGDAGAIARLTTKSTVLHFAWRPVRGPAPAYAMEEPADQHTLAIVGGAGTGGGSYPVVVSLHGQPRRGQAPRDYQGPAKVLREVEDMVARALLPPLILALPVYRHLGQPWPGFDLGELRIKLDEVLASQGLVSRGYFALGHSAAAGCGGDGLNGAVRLRPSAVAFLDTCVGPDLGRAVRALREASIPTFLLHSVETAGFARRQPTEYMASFDFGQVYRPMGIAPISCDDTKPLHPLRDQPFRCAASPDGIVRAFVIDTGAGEAAHEEALLVGLRYFLSRAIR